jgi:multiple sugar transport system permease protein
MQVRAGQALLRVAAILPSVLAPVVAGLFWRSLVLAPDFGILDFVTRALGLGSFNWLGDPQLALVSVIAIHTWQWTPFAFLVLLASLAALPPDIYEAARLDRAGPWQRFRYITYPLLTPIIAVVMTFSVLFTFTDFQLIYVITRGGPLNATHLMATLSFQRAIPGGALGEGAAISIAMVPFLLAAILFSYFGLQRRAWQQGGAD